jgi:hypothetical protein
MQLSVTQQAEEVPRCACHGERMYWHKDGRRKRGGSWRCRVARRSLDRQSWARAIKVGSTYYGRAATAEQATAINAHLRALLAGFRAEQTDERRQHRRALKLEGDLNAVDLAL